MKPAIALVIIAALLVGADLLFFHGQGVRAIELWFSHLVHQRVVD